MIWMEVILNDQHLSAALVRALTKCRHRLFFATADLKDVHLPLEPSGRYSRSVSMYDELMRKAKQGVDVHILHGAVPSGPMLERIRSRGASTLILRRCPRMHVKAIIVDGRAMYLGSANLTGAGIGAKGKNRRNFEAGIWTEDLRLVDEVADMLHRVWEGEHCSDCGRKDVCPVPLEEPSYPRG